jgi:predicted N-acetyltransferase YhbS
VGVKVVPIAAVADAAVERLLDRAFGPDRHGRTAYRIRDGMAALPALSLAAIDGDALVGTIQCWPIALHRDDGGTDPLVMLGPVAVEPELQRGGVGRMLVARALAAAETAGSGGEMMLIGDPEYYGRFFGFTADRTALWRVPGPVEQRRLLARGEVPAVAGMLGPRVRAIA